MDDLYLYETAPDGRKFRACIFESKYVPLGCCRYTIDAYVSEVDWWYTVEDDYGAWLWDDAETHCTERLSWWAANWQDMPVAKQLV
jgi:hypothetical protein